MKKIAKNVIAGVIFLCTAVFVTGCGDYVGKEKSHPLFVKAGSCRVAGNYKDAAQYFEEFLYICPRSALAHYELASVYGDNLDDPFLAMYHYGKYLELSPESSDAEDVKKFAESCRKRLFEQMSKEYESLETEKAYNEAARLKNMLTKYVEYSNKLKEQNDQMRKIISERKFVREVSVQPLRTTDNSNVTPANDPFASASVNVQTKEHAAKPAPVPSGSSREYVVQSGDTLSKISKLHYGTVKYYPLIMKENKDVIGPKGILRPGMKLIIPAVGGTR